ncbi:hypothetical protein K438DRAFT_1939901 [Mycena galopus ATCC 62051]|nr:hypothetical protein K438DRAFT_1939901 [Mycena galopus ATCC 62051]
MSVKYIRAMFVDWFSAHQIFMDRCMAANSGLKLANDHTFWVVEHTGKLKGESVHTVLHSVVNEWEEVRSTILCLTKSMTFVEGTHQGIESGPLRTRASVLPAVELNESVFFKDLPHAGIDTSSFNPMALQFHNGHNESQSDAIFKEINPWHDPEDPDTEMTLVTERAGGQSSNAASTQNFAQSILTFSTVNTAAIDLPSTSALGVYQPSQPLPTGKPKKRCVVCVYFNCRRQNSCAGSGGRELCG